MAIEIDPLTGKIKSSDTSASPTGGFVVPPDSGVIPYDPRVHGIITNIEEPSLPDEPVLDESREAELVRLMHDTLKEYGGMIGSIPINHDYWHWKNELQTLLNK